jgi:kynureninase
MDQFSLEFARHLDFLDPLKEFRQKFVFSNANFVYLDGNSLGMLPVEAPIRMDKVINDEWGKGLIGSWNTGWYERSRKISAKIASIIGARPDEVIIADSTSVNIFKLAYAALRLQEGKKGIVSDELNFPSDLYLFQGLVDLFGHKHDLRLAKSYDNKTIGLNELDERMGDDTALLSLSHVVFKSSFMYDVKLVTDLAHQKGAMVLWDLSHAVGAVPVDLNGCNADMAVGCTYKYLNGGPGSPAFLYVRKDLQSKLKSPVWGWFGQHNPFDFSLNYEPAPGIDRFLAGTPPLLSLSALEPGIDIILDAGMNHIRHKSIQQTNYLLQLYYQMLQPQGFKLGSPENENQRGSHISLRHPEAYRICKALIGPQNDAPVVIPDFREPDNIRIGITPLYTRFEDLFICASRLQSIVVGKLYENFSDQRENVT